MPSDAHNQQKSLTPDEIEAAANLVARWMPNNDGYQGSTEACEIMAAYARHLEEQYEYEKAAHESVEKKLLEQYAKAEHDAETLSDLCSELRAERNGLQEQLEAAREALTYAETLAYEHKPEWVAMFQEARESSPASGGAGVSAPSVDRAQTGESCDPARQQCDPMGEYEECAMGECPTCNPAPDLALEPFDQSDSSPAISPEPCGECDGKGVNTSWPHTTCPVCGGSGVQSPATKPELPNPLNRQFLTKPAAPPDDPSYRSDRKGRLIAPEPDPAKRPT